MGRRNPSWARDELILALDLYTHAGMRMLPADHLEVVALSRILNRLPIHTDRPDAVRFRNPNAVAMKLANFASVDPNSQVRGLQAGGMLDREVWQEFSEDTSRLRQLAEAIKSGHMWPQASHVFSEAEEELFAEGTIIYRIHRSYERDARLVRKVKDSALAQRGTLACEICGFDFGRAYGPRGEGCIECHHVRPLSEIGRRQVSRLRDLAIVCANCHRVIHRTRPWLQVEELRTIVLDRGPVPPSLRPDELHLEERHR